MVYTAISMSKLLDALNARLLAGPIPIEELLAEQRRAEAQLHEGSNDKEWNEYAKALSATMRDCWGTPDDLFAKLNAQYNFTLDVAAEPWNAKLSRWWGVGGELTNAFEGSLVGERWFCNPPFSDIERWLQWLWSFYDVGRLRARTGVLLIPATRTEQRWWEKYVEPNRDNPARWEEIRCKFSLKFLPGRTHYVPPPSVEASSPRFGSCLLIWEPL